MPRKKKTSDSNVTDSTTAKVEKQPIKKNRKARHRRTADEMLYDLKLNEARLKKTMAKSNSGFVSAMGYMLITLADIDLGYLRFNMSEGYSDIANKKDTEAARKILKYIEHRLSEMSETPVPGVNNVDDIESGNGDTLSIELDK